MESAGKAATGKRFCFDKHRAEQNCFYQVGHSEKKPNFHIMVSTASILHANTFLKLSTFGLVFM